MVVLKFAIWLTNCFSAFPGRWRVLRWIAGKAEFLELLPPKLLQLDEGSRLLIEAFNNRGHYVETKTLSKDQRVVNVFRTVLRNGDNVLDVGANIGRMSVLASRLIGNTGSVFAFEPSPKVITSLYRNLAINRCPNVTVFNLAIANGEGNITFHMPIGTNSAWGSIRDIGEDASISIEVPLRSLDNLDSLPDKVKLLKIDVEGADLSVIRGASALIRTRRPVVILEFSPNWIRQLGDDPNWLKEFMDMNDYYLYELKDEGLTAISQLPNQQTDILCLPEKLIDQTWSGLANMIQRRNI